MKPVDIATTPAVRTAAAILFSSRDIALRYPFDATCVWACLTRACEEKQGCIDPCRNAIPPQALADGTGRCFNRSSPDPQVEATALSDPIVLIPARLAST